MSGDHYWPEERVCVENGETTQNAAAAIKQPSSTDDSSDINNDKNNVPSSSSTTDTENNDNLGFLFSRREVVWFQETSLLLQLAIPNIILQVGIMLPNVCAAAYVGRNLGALYMSAFQLANNTANLLTLSLLWGLFTALDTLAPQSFGAGNYSQVGVVVVRGYIASMALLLPIVMFSAIYITDLLVAVGQDPMASQYAATWYRIFCLCLPCYALYMVTWKFLSAQNVMYPLVLAAVLTNAIVLPLAMKYWTLYFGFAGSAAAVVTYQCCQPAVLLLYLYIFKPHKTECWPGLREAWRQAVQSWESFELFFYLGAGGILSSSEWIFWETLSIGVGLLGVLPLSIHAVPTQVILVSFMIPASTGIALAVRLGVLLPQNVRRSKQVAVWTFSVCTIVFGVLSFALYLYRSSIFHIFAYEPDVLDGCERIWWKVCTHLFFLSLFAINTGIAVGLGMQFALGSVTFLFLWFFALPGAWYFGITIHRSIDVVWTWLIPPYVLMNMALLVAFARKDWHRISKDIKAREQCVGECEMLLEHGAAAQSHYGSHERAANGMNGHGHRE